MSSVLPLSFSWGFNPKLESEDRNQGKEDQASSPSNKPQNGSNVPKITPLMINTNATLNLSSGNTKRRFQDDDEQTCRYTTTAFSPRKINNNVIRKPTRTNKHNISAPVKKSRSATKIQGQQLPASRLVESLDHESLKTLLTNLITTHPEITDSVYKCSPRPSVESCIDILRAKAELIIAQLPYKVDIGSEYAYLRVKPYIDDFLHALSDYTLNFLSPVEVTPGVSLEFLDHATTLLHKLPHFNKPSNNYFSDLAYEQLGQTWVDSLKEFIKAGEDDSGIYVLINQGWENKLRTHNEQSNGRLGNASDWFSGEVKDVQELDAAKRFNFSMGNSPIVRGIDSGNLLQGGAFR